MAALLALLKDEAMNSCACEGLPAVAVAVPVAGRVNKPRTVALPVTSSVATGVVVPMPTFAVVPVPVCVIVEL